MTAGRIELGEKDRKIVNYIKRDPAVSIAQIAMSTGIPLPTVQKRIQGLIQEGFLAREMRVYDPEERVSCLFKIDLPPSELRKIPGGEITNYDGYAKYVKGLLSANEDLKDLVRIQDAWVSTDGLLILVVWLRGLGQVWQFKGFLESLDKGSSRISVVIVSRVGP